MGHVNNDRRGHSYTIRECKLIRLVKGLIDGISININRLLLVD